MSKIVNYIVEYNLDGEKHAKPIEALNPGSAFFKVLRKHPEAELIQCSMVGRFAGQKWCPVVSQTYKPPKNQGMPKKTVTEKQTQELMPWA